MKIPVKLYYIVTCFLLAFTSCKKEFSCENCGTNPPVGTNKPPIANAGPDRAITLPLDSISLDGSSSRDPDGTIRSVAWTRIAGPTTISIVEDTAVITKVKNLTIGTYRFELKVTDNGGLSSKDTMQVVVTSLTGVNQPPIANAGNDTTILHNGSGCNSNSFNIVLDGSTSFDVDGTIVSYAWSGPGLIVNPNAAITTVTGLTAADNRFILEVRDDSGNRAVDTILIHFVDSGRPILQARLVPFGMLSDAAGAVAVAAVGNKILFAGGWATFSINPIGGENTSRVDIYDIVTNQWTTAELSVARNHMAVVIAGNKVFFAGGGDTDGATFSVAYPNVDIYDAATNTWSVTYLSRPASGLVGATVGNKVFFAGGHDFIGPIQNSIIDIYDLNSNNWSTASLSVPRAGISANTAGNKIYFAGGVTSANVVTDRIDIYDHSTGSWSTGTMMEPKAGMASIAVNGKIYWAGGYQGNGPQGYVGSTHVEIRDLSTQASFITCLSQLQNGYQAVEKNNQIIIIGRYGPGSNKFDVYDIATNTWSIGILPQIISDFGFISVNNTIYVASGNIGSTFPRQVYKLEF